MAVDVAGDRDRRVPEHIRDRFDVHPDLLHACLARGGLDGPHQVARFDWCPELRGEHASAVGPLITRRAAIRRLAACRAPAASPPAERRAPRPSVLGSDTASLPPMRPRVPRTANETGVEVNVGPAQT